MQDAIKQLTGAINAQIALVKEIDRRLLKVEQANIPIPNQTPPDISLRSPVNEEELKEISRLPDCVKELQVFDGNPTNYISWIHNVENILKDYEIIRSKPIYRAILQSIRQKIRGPADAALISYNIFGDDWNAMKKCLSLHYADKRDIRTLEHQLNLLNQGSMTLDEFYANVNHQFSLIVNKIKTEDYSTETINVLIETYRNRALDVFIRGVNGDLSRMLIIQKPQTLPEAYTSCLDIQNLNFRNITIQKPNSRNSITVPVNQIFSSDARQTTQGYPLKPAPRGPPRPLPFEQRNKAYNIQHEQSTKPPPRPSQPKPPVPMEIDRSIQTKQVNYMNRPNGNNYPLKRDNDSGNYPQKQQRLNYLDTEELSSEEYLQTCENEMSDECSEEIDQESQEINFMTQASLVYLT